MEDHRAAKRQREGDSVQNDWYPVKTIRDLFAIYPHVSNLTTLVILQVSNDSESSDAKLDSMTDMKLVKQPCSVDGQIYMVFYKNLTDKIQSEWIPGEEIRQQKMYTMLTNEIKYLNDKQGPYKAGLKKLKRASSWSSYYNGIEMGYFAVAIHGSLYVIQVLSMISVTLFTPDPVMLLVNKKGGIVYDLFDAEEKMSYMSEWREKISSAIYDYDSVYTRNKHIKILDNPNVFPPTEKSYILYKLVRAVAHLAVQHLTSLLGE